MSDQIDLRSGATSGDGPTPPSPQEFASDGTTLVAVVDAFEAQGYTAQMVPREGALIRCGGCRMEHAAAEFAIESMRRTEGASDPADMAMVAAVACPHCQAKGTVVLHFGPDASVEESDVLAALEDVRGRSGADATAGAGFTDGTTG